MEQAPLVHLIGLCASLGACVLGTLAFRRARAAETASAAGDPNAEVGAGVVRRVVSPLAVAMRPGNRLELQEVQTRLLRAGRRSRDSVDRYLEDKVLFLVGGVGFVLLVLNVVGESFGAVLALLIAAAAVRGPSWMLASKTRERQEAIAASLPNAVDLLMTCVRAGLSLENALTQIAENIENEHPTLADELRVTGNELDAGIPLPDALRRLANRVGLDDLSALCGVVAQAHGLGAPIADTLDEYAESSRRQHMATLEERAGKVAAKLTLPLAVFFLPAGMLVILGPAILQLARALQ